MGASSSTFLILFFDWSILSSDFKAPEKLTTGPHWVSMTIWHNSHQMNVFYLNPFQWLNKSSKQLQQVFPISVPHCWWQVSRRALLPVSGRLFCTTTCTLAWQHKLQLKNSSFFIYTYSINLFIKYTWNKIVFKCQQKYVSQLSCVMFWSTSCRFTKNMLG